MADFYSWGCAVGNALELADFPTAFWDNVKYGSQQALDASIIAPVIEKFMKGERSWQGTSSQLLAQLNIYAEESTKKLKGWPADPQWLSRKLAHIKPNLAQAGLEVTKTGRHWFFRWVGAKMAFSVIAEAGGESDAKNLDSVTIGGCEDATDAKKRYPEKIASASELHVDDARNANFSSSPSKKIDFYASDGTPVIQDDWIKKWKADGSKPIPVRDGKIRDLKKYLEQDDLNLGDLVRIRGFLWPNGDWPQE